MPKKSKFNIVSEASFLYILSEQNFIKNAKNGQFFFEKLFLWHFEYFSTIAHEFEIINGISKYGKLIWA